MSKYLDVALDAAKKAEVILLKYYSPQIHIDLKDDQSPVTIADRQAEELIIATIKASFPDHGFLGEESGEDHTHSDYTWIIDPIDGTKNYTRGVPLFGTQIALAKSGTIILGVSNMPLLHELIHAEQGEGAFLNGQPITVSNIAALHEAYLVYGTVSYFEERNVLSELLQLEKSTRGHRGFGDCWVYHLVAQGKVDIAIEAKIKIWDIAAASIIVTEAGGIVTDLAGKKVDRNTTSLIASNRQLHSQVLTILTHQAE